MPLESAAIRTNACYAARRGEPLTTTQDETRRVVESYFAAWTTRRVDDAWALLAADLE